MRFLILGLHHIFEMVKLDILNLVCRLIVVNISGCMIDYPQMGVVWDHVTTSKLGK